MQFGSSPKPATAPPTTAAPPTAATPKPTAQPGTPPAAATTPATSATPPPTQATVVTLGDYSWVSNEQTIAQLVKTVTTNRDPFMGGVTPMVVKIDETLAPKVPGADYSSAPINVPSTTVMTPPRENKQPIPLPAATTTFPSGNPLLVVKPFQPATPDFALSGIINSPSMSYAIISVDGQYYTLMKGETMPHYNWTMVNISPSSVVLKKNNQKVTLRMTGGSPK